MTALQTKKQEYKKILTKYIPESSVNFILGQIFEHNIKLVINKHRTTKYGDYRPPQKGAGHTISINFNLNPYSFLLTLLHEIAHLYNWNKFRNRVSPHGDEWKKEFTLLLNHALKNEFFHPDLRIHIQKYASKPTYSSSTHTELVMALSKFDPPSLQKKDDNLIYVHTLNQGDRFSFSKNRRFIIEEKLRKRIRCKEIASGKTYLFNPLAKVTLMNE